MRLTQRRPDQTTAHRSRWRFAVPVVCLLAGLLLATTHQVSAGREIRASDSPRLVDLVHDAQASVDRLTAQRDALAAQVESAHGTSSRPALSAMQARIAALASAAGLDPVRGPGLRITLTDAQRDADGLFPRDAAPDDQKNALACKGHQTDSGRNTAPFTMSGSDMAKDSVNEG